MEKIIFENLPSTKTPLNAENLNAIQENFENEICYKDGDTFVITADLVGGGLISNSATTLYFTIYTPKKMKKINNITLNAFNLTARGITGYLLQKIEMLSDFDGVITLNSSTENSILFQIKQNTAFNVTNNTPISFEINDLSLTFNE